MRTKSKPRLQPFNEHGIRKIGVKGDKEFLCHHAAEHKTPEGSVLIVECRIVLQTEDGRVWNSVVEVELSND